MTSELELYMLVPLYYVYKQCQRSGQFILTWIRQYHDDVQWYKNWYYFPAYTYIHV